MRAVYRPKVRREACFRSALIDVAVIPNAAVTADAVRRLFQPRFRHELAVAFGVFV